MKRRFALTGKAAGAVIAVAVLVSPLAALQSEQNHLHGRGRLSSERHVIKRLVLSVSTAEQHITRGVAAVARVVAPGSEQSLNSVSMAESCLNSSLAGKAIIPNPAKGFASSVPACQNAILSSVLKQKQNKNISYAPAAKVKPAQGAKQSSDNHDNSSGAGSTLSIAQPSGGQGSTKVTVLQPLQPLANCSHGTTLNVVAHQDDDLLFMNPDTSQAIAGGRCMRTVYLTAGDSGQSTDYWQNREAGAEAAYARMANVTNNWTIEQQIVNGQDLTVASLNNIPGISLIFIRLPDGNLHGEGFSATASQSLQNLLNGTIASVTSVDNANAFNKDQLTTMLTSIMQVDNPDQIHTLGLASTADGDHSDHLAAGMLTKSAMQSYGRPVTLTQYGGYPDRLLESNLTADDIAAKQSIFLTYAQYDNAVCQTAQACAQTASYGNYLIRQYKSDVSQVTQ